MFKTKQEIIVIQAEATDPITTGVVFWSHDKGTAKMLFQLQKDYVNQTLSEGTIVPICLDFVGGRHIYHAIIEDAINGIVSIVLEDNILGYVGRVTGSIYIELPDSRSLDTAGRFTFDIKRSPIDLNTPELEDYYWQGFGEIMEQYHESIAEIKSEAKALLDSLTADVTTAKTKVTQLEQSITTANTNLNARIDEINKKIDDNDVFTKAESSANVIDQIGGTESAILKKELIVDGNEGTASRDSNGVQEPFSQADYDDLNNPEKFVRSETLASERGAEIEFDFSVIETLERKYPYIFEGLTTNAEKFEKMHELLSSLYLTVDARGGGIRNNTGILGNYARCYSKASSGVIEALGDEYVNTSQNFKSMFRDLSMHSNRYYQIDAGSMLFFLVSKNNDNNDVGCVSDGVIPSWVEVKDIRLIVELEVNGRTIIEEMIAANHVQNLATQVEAEAGTDNAKTMTPLRTAQQIDKKTVTIAGNQTIGGIKNFKDGIMIDSVPVSGITRSVIYDDAGIGGYFNASDKFTLGAAGKIDKIVLIWSRVDDAAGTLLNYSWSQTVLSPDDIILGYSYRLQLTNENYKFVTFANEMGKITISGVNENSVAPNQIYRIKRIIAYTKK